MLRIKFGQDNSFGYILIGKCQVQVFEKREYHVTSCKIILEVLVVNIKLKITNTMDWKRQCPKCSLKTTRYEIIINVEFLGCLVTIHQVINCRVLATFKLVL